MTQRGESTTDRPHAPVLPMDFRYISESEVEQELTMPRAVEAVRGAFRALSQGTADNVPRVRAKAKGIVLHSMSAAADYLGLVGWKQYTSTRHGARFHVGLYSQQSGELLALVEADRLGQLRTGAVTGLAVDLLADPNLDRCAILGTGWQAESQLEAVAAVRTMKQIRCFSRREELRTRFAQKMTQRLGIEIEASAGPREAVEGMPLVITATSSRRPVLKGLWLADGALICAIGSNWLEKAELDVSTIRRAGRVVCDSVTCCRSEAGDFSAAIQSGDFDWSQATELADLVARPPDCELTEAITIFKSVGMAIEDVALGALLLDRA